MDKINVPLSRPAVVMLLELTEKAAATGAQAATLAELYATVREVIATLPKVD